jgi:hypothetical protein
MIESLPANDGEPKLTRVGTLRGLFSEQSQLPIVDGYEATARAVLNRARVMTAEIVRLLAKLRENVDVFAQLNEKLKRHRGH